MWELFAAGTFCIELFLGRQAVARYGGKLQGRLLIRELLRTSYEFGLLEGRKRGNNVISRYY
jgi:hypothetical protein